MVVWLVRLCLCNRGSVLVSGQYRSILNHYYIHRYDSYCVGCPLGPHPARVMRGTSDILQIYELGSSYVRRP